MPTTDTAGLSCFRLNHMDELDALCEMHGAGGVKDATEKIFSALITLERGRSYSLANLPDDKKELAVKICCLWIILNPSYEFSNDYTKIRHV